MDFVLPMEKSGGIEPALVIMKRKNSMTMFMFLME
jgi:hypothetical protein